MSSSSFVLAPVRLADEQPTTCICQPKRLVSTEVVYEIPVT